ncbi:MerR family transcriptional regulator, partial [Herbaspirillum sp. HC18]
SPNGRPAINRQLLAAKADEIDQTIKQLRAVSRGLRHAAACRAPSHAECPTFQQLLKAAALGALNSRRRSNDIHGIGK